jgi:trk system potassium uptake protein TrkA
MKRGNGNKEFVVVGLDSFGEIVALTLQERGHRVLGIDRDPATVQRLSDNLQDVVTVDATDHEVLASLGIDAFETALVAIGGDLAQAVLVTLALKEVGVRRVVCEAQSERDRRVLLSVGADEVITPDIESARAVVDMLTGQSSVGGLRVGHLLAMTWQPPRTFRGTLGDLLAGQPAEVRVLLLVGNDILLNPGPDTALAPGDQLLVVGAEATLRGLPRGN